jgi:hypothetical protein
MPTVLLNDTSRAYREVSEIGLTPIRLYCTLLCRDDSCLYPR